MAKQRGYTLIELIIAIILFMGIFIGVSAISGNNISWGLTGITETRCIEGYKFIITSEGRSSKQILDDKGHGVKC